jgi:alpha-beta hydrolase superfamily lysophospholipase
MTVDQAYPLTRRTLLAGLTAGAATGLVQAAHAQKAAAVGGAIWSEEYWANKGSVRLNLWRKRAGSPVAGAPARPVVFLVHGSSNSSRSSYDVNVPGHGEYSFMNVLAGYGYDVWTMDHDGYGKSGSSGNNSDIASGVEDLKAGIEVVTRETGRKKMHFFGTSSGAIRAGAYAQAAPEHIDRLVLSAFTYKGKDSPEMKRRGEQLEFYRTHNRRKRDIEMIRSIHTRDGLASSYDPAVAEAIAAQEMVYGDQVPTGTYLDMIANLPLVDPTKITCPVLMTRGAYDGNSTTDDLLDFYRQLPNGDKQFVMLPNAAHSPLMSINRQMIWHVVHEFLNMPNVKAV